MSITNTTQGQFHFSTQAKFNGFALGSTLEAGHLYFVENKVYLALTSSTYQEYGSLRVVDELPEVDAANVEDNVVYLDKTTNLLAIKGEVEVEEPETKKKEKKSTNKCQIYSFLAFFQVKTHKNS